MCPQGRGGARWSTRFSVSNKCPTTIDGATALRIVSEPSRAGAPTEGGGVVGVQHRPVY
jgi:hypothetical protein